MPSFISLIFAITGAVAFRLAWEMAVLAWLGGFGWILLLNIILLIWFGCFSFYGMAEQWRRK